MDRAQEEVVTGGERRWGSSVRIGPATSGPSKNAASRRPRRPRSRSRAARPVLVVERDRERFVRRARRAWSAVPVLGGAASGGAAIARRRPPPRPGSGWPTSIATPPSACRRRARAPAIDRARLADLLARGDVRRRSRRSPTRRDQQRRHRGRVWLTCSRIREKPEQHEPDQTQQTTGISDRQQEAARGAGRRSPASALAPASRGRRRASADRVHPVTLLARRPPEEDHRDDPPQDEARRRSSS